MATYDPPQPMWKRNLAGILDFFLAFFVCLYGVSKIFGNRFDAPDVVGHSYPSAMVMRPTHWVDGQYCWRLHWLSPISLSLVGPEARSFKGSSV
jgi:hypothetical protein